MSVSHATPPDGVAAAILIESMLRCPACGQAAPEHSSLGGYCPACAFEHVDEPEPSVDPTEVMRRAARLLHALSRIQHDADDEAIEELLAGARTAITDLHLLLDDAMAEMRSVLAASPQGREILREEQER